MELLTSELVKEQNEIYEIAIRDVWLVNLDKFFVDAFYITNHTAYSYNISFDFKNKDIKKIFYNAFVFTLCEFLKSSKRKNIFYFNSESDKKQYLYIVNRCKVLLPIYIYINNLPFADIAELIKADDLEVCSSVDKIILKSKEFNFQKFTFKRLSNFLKKNELVFLRDVYFTQHQIKLALLT